MTSEYSIIDSRRERAGDADSRTVFVVGTGRTGSTVLARILAQHGDVLVLSEFFTALRGLTALKDHTLTGAEYWSLLAEPHPGFTAMLRQGVMLPEFSYLHGERRRYSALGGVPAISLMTLPMLSDDPDAVLDLLAETVPRWARDSMGGHHRALFETLRNAFGGSVVVERSGHSLEWVTALRTMFPGARFVHMHRNGPDCALSMSRHAGYHTAALLGELLDIAGVSTTAELTELHIRRLPKDLADLWRADFLTAFTSDRSVPVARYGTLWSSLIESGLSQLAAVPSSDRMALGYEDLLENPQAVLTRLSTFLGVSDQPTWIRQAASTLDSERAGAADRLRPAERRALEAACEPGMRRLARDSDSAEGLPASKVADEGGVPR